MKRTAAVLMIFFLCSFSAVWPQQRESRVSVTAVGGYSSMMPLSIGTFDRSIWNADAGAALRISRFLLLDASYTYGGIIYKGSGYTAFSGFQAGAKYFFLKPRGKWSDGLYFRTGIFSFWPASFRSAPVWGFYLNPGIRIPLTSHISLHQEITLRLFAENTPAFSPGVSGGITFEF